MKLKLSLCLVMLMLLCVPSTVLALDKVEECYNPLILALSEDDFDQSMAISMFDEIKNESAVDTLIGELADNDNETRVIAALLLGWIGDERAVDPLIEMLDDENLDVRLSAALSLGWIGDTRAVDPLIEMLSEDDEIGKALKEKGIDLDELIEQGRDKTTDGGQSTSGTD